jgi:hypothetical protein
MVLLARARLQRPPEISRRVAHAPAGEDGKTEDLAAGSKQTPSDLVYAAPFNLAHHLQLLRSINFGDRP